MLMRTKKPPAPTDAAETLLTLVIGAMVTAGLGSVVLIGAALLHHQLDAYTVYLVTAVVVFVGMLVLDFHKNLDP